MLNQLNLFHENHLQTKFAYGKTKIMKKKSADYTGPEHSKLELMGELKAYLRDRGISQRHLVEATGVTKSHLSQMLSGTRTMNAALYLKIAEMTGFIPKPFRGKGDEIRMDLVQNRELFVEVLRKLYRIDRAGSSALSRVNTYLEGLVDGQEIIEKKNY
jgi:transcriptional regulator with XRE-family HTH domain